MLRCLHLNSLEDTSVRHGSYLLSRQARIGIKLVGARVRLKIFMSLIQVMSSLGTVFEIGFPPIFAGVMKWIGVLQVRRHLFRRLHRRLL